MDKLTIEAIEKMIAALPPRVRVHNMLPDQTIVKIGNVCYVSSNLDIKKEITCYVMPEVDVLGDMPKMIISYDDNIDAPFHCEQRFEHLLPSIFWF